MEAIDRIRADQLLLPLGVEIGGWNELRDLPPSETTHRAYSPPSDALGLYVAAHRLANWINLGSWTLLQIDNSTSPTGDEVAIFEKLILNEQQPWNIAAQHTFLLDGDARKSTLVLLIYFALLFAWHIHLASETSLRGQRLALQDGVAYFFGNAATIRSADELITSLAGEPRALAS